MATALRTAVCAVQRPAAAAIATKNYATVRIGPGLTGRAPFKAGFWSRRRHFGTSGSLLGLSLPVLCQSHVVGGHLKQCRSGIDLLGCPSPCASPGWCRRLIRAEKISRSTAVRRLSAASTSTAAARSSAAENKFPRSFTSRRVRAETSCAAKRDWLIGAASSSSIAARIQSRAMLSSLSRSSGASACATSCTQSRAKASNVIAADYAGVRVSPGRCRLIFVCRELRRPTDAQRLPRPVLQRRPSSRPISCQRSGSGVCAIRPRPEVAPPERPCDTPTDASLWRGRANLRRRPSNEREARPHPGSHREPLGARPSRLGVPWEARPHVVRFSSKRVEQVPTVQLGLRASNYRHPLTRARRGEAEPVRHPARLMNWSSWGAAHVFARESIWAEHLTL
jgi:hypothetical protein